MYPFIQFPCHHSTSLRAEAVSTMNDEGYIDYGMMPLHCISIAAEYEQCSNPEHTRDDAFHQPAKCKFMALASTTSTCLITAFVTAQSPKEMTKRDSEMCRLERSTHDDVDNSPRGGTIFRTIRA